MVRHNVKYARLDKILCHPEVDDRSKSSLIENLFIDEQKKKKKNNTSHFKTYTIYTLFYCLLSKTGSKNNGFIISCAITCRHFRAFYCIKVIYFIFDTANRFHFFLFFFFTYIFGINFLWFV